MRIYVCVCVYVYMYSAVHIQLFLCSRIPSQNRHIMHMIIHTHTHIHTHHTTTRTTTSSSSSSTRRVKLGGEKHEYDDSIKALGQEMDNLISMAIDQIWEPEKQQEKMVSIGIRYHSCGMLKKHVVLLGDALALTLRDLAPDVMTMEMDECFRWMYRTSISRSLSKVLQSCEDDIAGLVSTQWEDVQGRHTSEELGDMFFNALEIFAPELLHLFKRPKKIQVHIFTQVMEMLVASAYDPDTFFVSNKPISVRHIKYGVKAENLKPYGQVRSCVVLIIDANYEENAVLEVTWNRVFKRSLNACIYECVHTCNVMCTVLCLGDTAYVKHSSMRTP
jgi:hypothetical protein